MADSVKKEKEKQNEEALQRLRKEITEEIENQLPEQFRLTVRRREKTAGGPLEEVQTEEEAKRVIEAVLFASPKPVTLQEFKRALGGMSVSKIEALVRDLKQEYESQGRSFRIREIAGGFECATETKYAPWITKLEIQKKARQATQSALETLAILAYKQPITRVEIEDLRGVDVSGVLQTLMEKKFVKVVGKKEAPGRPFLYGTTEKFLEHFGLKSLEDLPNITQIREMVEQSVKVENLFRTEKMISNEEEQEGASTQLKSPLPREAEGEGKGEGEGEEKYEPQTTLTPSLSLSKGEGKSVEMLATTVINPDQKGSACERQ